MNLHADAAQRLAIYNRLMARNRLIAILRIGVPALGVIALLALLGQIFVSSLGSRFGVGQITVTGDSISVVAPEYSGLLDDGTAYRVSATGAQAAPDATDQVTLTDAAVTMTRPGDDTFNIDTPSAVLDTTRQLVLIAGQANVSNSLGTRGILLDSVFDYQTQALTGNGPVDIDYADGTHLVAEGMTYDAVKLVWTFTRATVTLPDTPGAATAAGDSTETP